MTEEIRFQGIPLVHDPMLQNIDAIHDTLRKAKAHFTQHSQTSDVYCGKNFLVNYCKHIGVPENEVDAIFGECWSEEHGFYILKGEMK